MENNKLSVQTDRELTESHNHILKGSNGDMQVGGKIYFQQVTHQCLCARRRDSHTEECYWECSLWGCKYLGLFTESFTADLFPHSNDQNAFCLRPLHGNGFRKFDPSHVVRWFAGTRAVFLSQLLLMISQYSNHIGVMNYEGFALSRPVLLEGHICIFHNVQQLCGRLDSRHSLQLSLLITDG